jgi:small GTP-binding protein
MTDKHKVCMLGASGVGKTSLVTRFVHRVFSETYRTTIGVTIDKKRVRVGQADARPRAGVEHLDAHEIDLVIWDLSGEDEFQSVCLSYTRGASGFIAVVDGTRSATAEVALALQMAGRAIAGDVPCVFVLNKADLVATWELDEDCHSALRRAGSATVKTSAKTGVGVEEAFSSLACAMAARTATTREGAR